MSTEYVSVCSLRAGFPFHPHPINDVYVYGDVWEIFSTLTVNLQSNCKVHHWLHWPETELASTSSHAVLADSKQAVTANLQMMIGYRRAAPLSDSEVTKVITVLLCKDFTEGIKRGFGPLGILCQGSVLNILANMKGINRQALSAIDTRMRLLVVSLDKA